SITHDAGAIEGLDRVLWLEDRAILADGSPAELAADPDSRYAPWILEQRAAADVGQPGTPPRPRKARASPPPTPPSSTTPPRCWPPTRTCPASGPCWTPTPWAPCTATRSR